MTEYNFTNKLSNEKSPYLLQHAHNPVDWYPWGPEAFARAVSEDKPIFLSIGYSTCHWCHVMERESFEDPETAEVLNKYFISIKVDREERPDIDTIYMTVCQAMTGSGGWPLTIFMTPDRKPFFAGTYYPKHDRMGMNGFLSLLDKIRKAWSDNRDAILNTSTQILAAINEPFEPDNIQHAEFQPDLPEDAFYQFKSNFDSIYGGFGSAPKFPTPHNLYFLLRYWYNTKDDSALEIVEKTLDSMYRGGIYDHIGFGFSRYSTDRKWLVPHFEKMLYDNALLSIAYLEAYQATGNEKYAVIARQIFTYILRDMTSPEGGFFSAEDADSEGKEGKFYVWAQDEIRQVLGDDNWEKFCKYYDITVSGNFEGLNIPNLIKGDFPSEDKEFVENCRQKLFNQREKRVHPYKDDKILTAWNGLMIAALAIGGRFLGIPEYTTASERAADFIFKMLIRKDGRLLARYRDGEASFPAYVDDYAFLIWGLVELYETTFDPDYLKKAVNLNKDLLKYFWDGKKGGLHVYGSDSEQLIARPKEIYDGATPSGNSVSAMNLLRLARLTGDNELEDKAHELLNAFSNSIQNYPRGYSFSLIALLFAQSSTQEIVIVSEKRNAETQTMLDIINEDYRPFTISVLKSSETKEIEKVIPFTADYGTINGKSTAYICRNYSCKAPITDSEAFRSELRS